MEEIVFRRAIDADIIEINRFYNSVYNSDRDKQKFDWEFNSSPAGKAIYVIAEYKDSIIGTQCVIPYFLITDDNKILLSGKSEDTLVSQDHRGKQIFEKMYSLLIKECEKDGILLIWGFTYAAKPFLKLGFKIPYRSRMGVLVLNPVKSVKYFSSLSSKNKFNDKAKIIILSLFSWFKSKILYTTSGFRSQIDFINTEFNNASFNYLKYKNTFGLKLNTDFIEYRTVKNPYNKNYKTVNYKKDGFLLASVIYNITEQKVGYLIHVYISDKLSWRAFRKFLRTIINNSELKTCVTLRFWGFTHNQQNKEEIEMLSAGGFTFINRGISFVWLTLDKSLALDPKNFVLSRMSSQGTD